ncbi:hypothetical protein OG982_30090 [Streptomyces sp. NBC_01551]|uniref:hypothetical protein n=1 Tax=Streptomyces sp. NBC_01551 TaxID=2975876 RepID=UPI0022581960|nr:hypothetical protein [Streptomyces sp. NBC_01551]MCX4529895.1 hypothetical protein [Streptomyces sp. NBC_01551]
MARTLARLIALLAAFLILMTSGSSIAFAGAKPPDPYPKGPGWEGLIGISKKTGEYCQLNIGDLSAREDCREPVDCKKDYPAHHPCIGDDSIATPEEALEFNRGELKRWKEDFPHKKWEKFGQLSKFLEKCVENNKSTWLKCKLAGETEFGAPSPTVSEWVAGEISKMAASALEEAASMLGQSVVWVLQQFADKFNEITTINLAKTGIGPMLGITTGLSVLIAAFLLLVQFGKVAVSQQGGPAATAIVGLAKWAAILAVYLLATQTALNWSDTLSAALVDEAFKGGDAMKTRMGEVFAGLFSTGATAGTAGTALVAGTSVTAGAVGFVIVMAILCILAIGALWIEMLVRQAAIMLLIISMPIVLAGQMTDSTRTWWPTARNALIATILTKPVIVICFSVGFTVMKGAEGTQNVIVGFMIFVIAGTAWPVLARFMTFTTNGDGNSTASGVISSVGSSMGSMFGGNQASPSGAGTAGGGSGYTKALEGDNESNSGGSSSAWSKALKGSGGGGSFASPVAAAAMALQLAAVSKDVVEGAFQNQAANAGLGPAAQGGRGIVGQRSGDGDAPSQADGPSPAPAESAGPAPEPPPPPAPPSNQPTTPRPPDQPTQYSATPPPPTSTGS